MCCSPAGLRALRRPVQPTIKIGPLELPISWDPQPSQPRRCRLEQAADPRHRPRGLSGIR
jgi:hypothetical protein